MIVCQKCHHENSDDASFCVNCGFTLWLDPVPSEPLAEPHAAPPQDHPPPEVAIEPTRTRLAGGATGECVVRVYNPGPGADSYRLQATPGEACDATVQPSVLTVGPSADAAARLLLRLHEGAVQAGSEQIDVHVTSEAAPEASAFATVTIEKAKKRPPLPAVLAAAAAALLVLVLVLVIFGRGNGGGAAGGGGGGGTGGGTGGNSGVAATVDSSFASVRVHSSPAGGSHNVVGHVHDGDAITVICRTANKEFDEIGDKRFIFDSEVKVDDPAATPPEC